MAYIIKRSWTAKLPNGKKVKKRAKAYSIRIVENGRRRWVSGYTDKKATEQKAAQLEAASARGETGLLNPFKASVGRPLKDHVAEYLADLEASGRSPRTVTVYRRRLEVLLEETRWATIRDMSADSFMQWRARAKNAPRRGTLNGEKTTTANTLNRYLEIVRAFTNWLATAGRMPGVPIGNGKMMATVFAGVSKVDGPARRIRRALTDDQVAKLLSAATPDRQIVYRLALAVGLRRDELQQLQWGDLRLAAIKPYLSLRSQTTKARRGDRISLPLTLATDLRLLRPDDATDSDLVFAKVPSIKWWKADLKTAGIPYLDAQGRQADFHGGTRKTLNTRMHRQGIPLAIAMRTMRHTDARLTMVDYTDDDQLGMDEDTAILPEIAAATEKRSVDGALNASVTGRGIKKGTAGA